MVQKKYFYSAELLAAPCEKRAERGHENHPEMKERLEYLTLLATNLRLETLPSDSGAEVVDNDDPHPIFDGEFLNSIEDIQDFIDVMDAALLHQMNADFYTKSKSQAGFIPKKIVVVGGGPSGMFAAIEALLHGHEVTVIEARSIGVRTRLLGMYPSDVMDLVRFGAPIELFHDTFSWCDKYAGTLYDMERMLGAIALKLGATIYRNAKAQAPESGEDFEKGELIAKFNPPSKVTKVPTTGRVPQTAIIQCNHHNLEHMPTEVKVHFDMILDCAGSGRPITKFLVGKGNDSIDYLHILAGEELRDKSAEKSFYYEEDDEHINDILDTVDWDTFLNDMEKGLSNPSVCPQNRHVTALIANLNRDIFKKDKDIIDVMSKCAPEHIAIPIPSYRHLDSEQVTKIGKKTMADRQVQVAVEVQPRIRKSVRTTMVFQRDLLGITAEHETTTAELFNIPDAKISRILLEGICPHKFTTGDGESVLSREFLSKLNHQDSGIITYAYLTASIDPSNLDNDGFVKYIKKEASWANPVQNATCAMVFEPKGLRCMEDFTFHGQVPGTEDGRPSYFVIGDACQDAWYRWGVGIKDAFNSVRSFSNCLGKMDANKDDPQIKAYVDQLQLRMRKRLVQTSAYFWHYGVTLENDPKMMKAYETMKKMLDMKQGKEVQQKDQVTMQAADMLESLEEYEE